MCASHAQTPSISSAIPQANDPAQFNGQTAYVGINTDTLGPVSNFVYRSDCWNGGFEQPAAYLRGSWAGSFFYIGLSAGGWRADLFTFAPGSSNNVLNAGAVASGAWLERQVQHYSWWPLEVGG